MTSTENPRRAELVQALFESMSAMKRGMTAQWQSAGHDCPISHGQLELLFTIFHGQPVSFKQLARQLYLTPGAVSQMVEGLEQHQLITRQTDAKDRRVQCLEVSPDGMQLIERIKQQRHGMMERVMADLSDQELELWLRIQKKILEQLEVGRTNQYEKETA